MKNLFFFLLIKLMLFSNENNIYLQINLIPYPVGMFSVFSYVASVLYEYDNHNYAGVEVDFRNAGLYYCPKLGPNWWNYFCEPVQLGNKNGAVIKEFNTDEYISYAYFLQRSLTKEQVFGIINKYIKIRSDILSKINRFVFDNFDRSHVIGVHYRGTDKVSEAPRVPYENVKIAIDGYLTRNKIRDFKIFVATDEMNFFDYIKAIYGDNILTYSTQRSTSNEALHLKLSNNYLHGEEAFIDCILLSRCDMLIRTSSNLSLWSTYFNPNVPEIVLSERY